MPSIPHKKRPSFWPPHPEKNPMRHSCDAFPYLVPYAHKLQILLPSFYRKLGRINLVWSLRLCPLKSKLACVCRWNIMLFSPKYVAVSYVHTQLLRRGGLAKSCFFLLKVKGSGNTKQTLGLSKSWNLNVE